MRRFLKNIGLFLLVPLSIFIPLEIGIASIKDDILKEDNLEKRYFHNANEYGWLELLDSNSLNVLAGSSSVRYGLSCKELNKLNPDNSMYVNLAMDARDPIQTYFILKNINLSNVTKVYFGLDPWIYTKRYYKHRYSILYLDFNLAETFLYSKEHDKAAFIKRYKELVKYFFKSKELNGNKNFKIPKDFGSVKLKRTAVNFNTNSDWFQLEKYGWSYIQFEYLKKIEILCKKNNINFSVFIPPKRVDYTEFYKLKHKNVHEEFTTILSRHDLESNIFGKYDILNKKNDSSLFSEAYHLNENGQIAFSKIFYELSTLPKNEYHKNYSWFTEK